MTAATWRATGRGLPGPVAAAVWMLVTVPGPLIFFEATHRGEEDPHTSTVLWWTVASAPALAATVAAKWAWRGRHRRTVSAVVAATLVSAVYVAVYVAAVTAVHRWILPLSGATPWRNVLFAGVPLVVCGAAVGHLYARGRPRPRPTSARRGYLAGGVVAVVGVLLAQPTVRLGAGAAAEWDAVQYGGVGPYISDSSGEVTLPAAGRYGIFAVGFAPTDPRCRIGGAGRAAVPAQPVRTAPAVDGGDHASFAWVATFDVPEAGTYALSCAAADARDSYVAGEVPRVRGAAGALIHRPAAAIWLLGAIPGLLIIFTTRRRHGGYRVASMSPAKP